MARTIGHTIHRYVGHKMMLAEQQRRKYGARAAVRRALRQAAERAQSGRRAA